MSAVTGSTDTQTGFRPATQVPLVIKGFCLNEGTLTHLGLNNQLAFSYEQGMLVYCAEEKTRWEWREVESDEELTGLIPEDFVYPTGAICFGIDYSNKLFNFFPAPIYSNQDIIDIIGTLPAGTAGSIWRVGIGAPSNTLGVDNDQYLNSANGYVYSKIAGIYIITANIKGADGNDGADGLNADITRTSITSNGLTTGFKTFAFSIASNNLGWGVGMRLRFTPIGFEGVKYMEGYVSSVFPTLVIVVIEYVVGSGTYANWNIGVAGDVGVSSSLQKTVNTSTNYTLLTEDDQYTILINNGIDDVTVTVPTGLIDTFSCIVIADGTGSVTFIESSTTIDFLPGTGLTLIDTNAWAVLQKVAGSQRFKLGGQVKA